MTQKQKKQVQKIMQTLHGQRFYDFYKDGGKWDDYIVGGNRTNDKKKMEKEIQEEIKSIFNIK